MSLGVSQANAVDLSPEQTAGASVAPFAASGGIVKVGTGHVDPSTLTVVGMIDPTTGVETALPQPFSPAPVGHTGVTPMITNPPCNGRIDFYRIISSTGDVVCFANAGTLTLSTGHWNAMYLCPGNNKGRTEWLNGNTNTWSVWRGPATDYNTCYSFGYDARAFAVQIK